MKRIQTSKCYAYAVDCSNNLLFSYSINNSSGELTAINSPVQTGSGPTYVKIHPSGQFVYLINVGDPNKLCGVSGYTIDQSTGVPKIINDKVMDGLPPNGNIFFHPSKKLFLYFKIGKIITLYNIGLANGALVLGRSWNYDGTASYVTETFDPLGTYLYTFYSNGHIQTLRVAPNGTMKPLNHIVQSDMNPRSCKIDPKGNNLYVVAISFAGSPVEEEYVFIYRFKINNESGELSFENSSCIGKLNVITSVALTTSCEIAYAFSANQKKVTTFFLDSSTGGFSSQGEVNVPSINPVLFTIDPLSRFAYVMNQGTPYDTASIAIFTVEAGIILPGATLVELDGEPHSYVFDPSSRFLYILYTIGGIIDGLIMESYKHIPFPVMYPRPLKSIDILEIKSKRRHH